MAHEISNINGRDEAFYALTPAWHGLGTVLDHAPTSEAAMEAAGLNWAVEKREIQTVDGLAIKGHMATVRTDCNGILGVVGDGYEVIQNHEAFGFLDSLLQDGVMKYESAGALRGGRIIWALARMPSVDTIAEGDNVNRYILFSAAHDGSGAIHAIPTGVRVVCANTHRIAVQGLTGIRHTASARSRLEIAKRYLSQFDEKFTLYRDHARKLAGLKYGSDAAKQYIETLFPQPEKSEGRAVTIRENKVQLVRDALRSERQTIPSIRGTWWSLVNAVTESVDHAPEKSQPRNEAHRIERREKKFLSLVDGPGADFKTKAFELALSMAS